MLELKQADIVLTISQSTLGKLIRFFEKAPYGEAASVFNHVGVITVGGTDPQITEALWHVRKGSLWTLYGPAAGAKRPEIAVYRPIKVGAEDAAKIAAAAEEYVGRRYGWWQLILQAGDYYASKKAGREIYAFRQLNFSSRVICSQLVGRAFASVGLLFGIPEGAVPNPDDIADFLDASPDKYVKIYGPGKLG
jgi:hypothetical protein